MLRIGLALLLSVWTLNAQALEYYLVTGDNVRVREYPHGPVATQVHKGDFVIKITEKDDWTQVFIKSGKDHFIKGWVSSSFLISEQAVVEKLNQAK